MRSTRVKVAAAAMAMAVSAGLLAVPAPAPAQSENCAGADATPQSTTLEALSESMRCLLNAERAEKGMRPLSRSNKILRAANVHAKDMVKRHFVSHIGSDGSTPLSRLRRTGFLKGAKFFAVGEDLAWGEKFQVTPANVVKAWVNSPVHRRNIFDKRFNRVGVGIFRGDPRAGGSANPDALTYVAVFAVVKR